MDREEAEAGEVKSEEVLEVVDHRREFNSAITNGLKNYISDLLEVDGEETEKDKLKDLLRLIDATYMAEDTTITRLTVKKIFGCEIKSAYGLLHIIRKRINEEITKELLSKILVDGKATAFNEENYKAITDGLNSSILSADTDLAKTPITQFNAETVCKYFTLNLSRSFKYVIKSILTSYDYNKDKLYSYLEKRAGSLIIETLLRKAESKYSTMDHATESFVVSNRRDKLSIENPASTVVCIEHKPVRERTFLEAYKEFTTRGDRTGLDGKTPIKPKNRAAVAAYCRERIQCVK